MKQTEEAQQAKAANVAREVPLCVPAAIPRAVRLLLTIINIHQLLFQCW